MLQDSDVVLTNYMYTGLTGIVYHPFIKNGKWYIIPTSGPVSFLEVIYFCEIPDEDATILKLKYGGS